MFLKQAFSTTDGVTDLLYVATNIVGVTPPESFTPDLSALIPPVNPGSLDSHFGAESDYEFRDLYVRYYDSSTNTWSDGDTGAVNADVKADVAAVKEALDIYAVQKAEYDMQATLQRDVQWRKIYAQALIDVCDT